jgi:hypothetical protein
MRNPCILSALMLSAVLVAGCTTARSTAPVRTASEQLLISAAADRAAAQLSLAIPKGTRVFVDTRYFQGYDDGYAIAAIRTQMLKNGLMVVDDRPQAEAVVMVSSGALSTDQKSLLIGLPQLTVPYIPVGNSVTVPEIALFKQAEEKGVAKFVATGYDAKTGKLLATTDPRYGFAHNTNHTVLLFFSWATGDVVPPGVDQKSLSFQTLTSMLPGGN